MDWNLRYQQFGRVFGDSPTPFLKDRFPSMEEKLPSSAYVLCPGDGYGRNGLWIARRGHKVRALDISSYATSWANETAASEGLDYEASTSDLRTATPGGTKDFDCIVHLWCRLPHQSDRVAWNQKAFDSLAPGGTVILTSSTRLTTSEVEASEWPPMEWEDMSTEDEVRLMATKPSTNLTPCGFTVPLPRR